MKSITWKDLGEISQKKESKKGKVFLLPTDTVYGFHSSVDDKEGIANIEEVKRRDEKKTFIVLISSMRDLEKFSVETTKRQRELLKKVWPGRYTVVLKSTSEKYSHILKTKNTIAFRIPPHKQLLGFIRQFGPIVSTSANISGQDSISFQNIEQDIKIAWNDEEIEKITYYLESKNYKEAEASTIINFLR